MPLRFLIYVAQEYQKYVEEEPESIYGSRQIRLPAPRFVVFYNGEAKCLDEEILLLSNAFDKDEKEPELELKVRVLNINKGHNKALMERCKTLSEYSEFMERIRENMKRGLKRKRAISEAIDYALEHNILSEFLRRHRAEMPGMLLYEFDKKKYERTIRREGIEEGIEKGREILLIALVKDGEISLESAAKRLNITVDEFRDKINNM